MKTNLVSRLLSRFLKKLRDNILPERFLTTETVEDLNEIEVYVNTEVMHSIESDTVYRGNPHISVMLRCFANKKRKPRKLFIFFTRWIKFNQIAQRFYQKTIAIPIPKLITSLRTGKKENGIYFVKLDNSNRVWKVYVKNKKEEPESFRKMGCIGYSISNAL